MSSSTKNKQTRHQDNPGAAPTKPTDEYDEFLEQKIRPLVRKLLDDERRKKAGEEALARVVFPELGDGDDAGEEVDPAPPQPGLHVYQMADVEARRQSGRWRDDSDSVSRIRATLEDMRKRGSWRPLRALSPDWRRELDELEVMFPNCSRLVDFLRSQAALAARGDGALPGMAVLLDGPPGVGKSVIVEAIAEIVGGGFKRIALAAAQSGGQLAGSDEFWSNSKPGVVFEALVHGDYANPVVQLDEIDKVAVDLPYHPLGALYDLLEPAMATQFRDGAMPTIPLDASRILWFATSNQRRFVMRPILDRLTVIEVGDPTAAQMAQIVTSVDRALHAAQPLLAGMALSEAAARALGTLPPRRLRKALQEAYGRAAYRGSTVVLPGDLPRLNDAVPAIGFH